MDAAAKLISTTVGEASELVTRERGKEKNPRNKGESFHALKSSERNAFLRAVLLREDGREDNQRNFNDKR